MNHIFLVFLGWSLQSPVVPRLRVHLEVEKPCACKEPQEQLTAGVYRLASGYNMVWQRGKALGLSGSTHRPLKEIQNPKIPT